jgi:hypothetical protein
MLYCNQTCYEFDCPYNMGNLSTRDYFSGASIMSTDMSSTSDCILHHDHPEDSDE